MSRDADWKFVDDFPAIERAIDKELEVADRNTAAKALRRAQRNAPVKTGNLRDSGHVGETSNQEVTGLITRLMIVISHAMNAAIV